ncbi:MAG: hypothetical protein AAFY38_06770 [Pseudomonadota bacterium]
MTARIVIHAGFHKTGTTSAQEVLRINRAQLKPHLRVVRRPGMVGLCEAARAYSVSRAASDLALVQYEAAELAEGFGRKPVLLSSEDLCGHMPGRRGLMAYDAAPKLVAAITRTFAAVHPRAEQRVILTTRAPEPWLRSCYVQHLRATPITLDAEAYAADYAASADLSGVAQAVARALDAHVALETLALEDIGALRLGPAEALLARACPALDLSPFTPAAPANTAPPQAKIDAMLAVNRAGLPEAERRAQMKTLHGRDW